MGMAVKVMQQFLESQEIKYDLVRDNVIRVGWNFEGGNMDIYFDFDDDDSRVHLEGLNFIKVTEDKYDKLYKVLNTVNDEYKYVKFVLDTENGQINARDDALIQLDSCAQECYELMIRMLQIVEGAYPEFMKALWG